MTNQMLGTAFLVVASDSPSPAGKVGPTPTGTPPSGLRPAVKPTQLSVVKKALNSVSLKWTDKTNKRWNVAYRVHTGGVWINVPANSLGTAARPFVLSGLYPGSNYDIQVAAVSASGKRGPYGNMVSARTNKGKPNGIWNIFARYNLDDRQLHIKWKNGPQMASSIAATISCGGTTTSFNLPPAQMNFPIKRFPAIKGCVLRLTPTYNGVTGPVYMQTFDTQ